MSAQGHHEAKAPIRSLKFSVSNEGYRWKDYSEKNVKVKQRWPKFRSRLKKVAIFTWWTKISVMFLSHSRWARIIRNARNQKISFLSVCLFLHSSSLSSHFGVPLACSVGFLTLRSSRSFIQPAIFTFDLEVKVVAGRGGGEVHHPSWSKRFFIFLNYSFHICSQVLLHIWCFGKPGKYANYSPFEDATGSTLV